jgi:hypothetical protein
MSQHHLGMSVSPQTVEILCELVESGLSLRAAGQRVGLSVAAVYRRLAPLGDQVQRRRRRPLTPQERQAILRAARDGELSIRRISAQVGRGWHVVRRILGDKTPRLAVAYRCPVCGHRVTIQPCLICRARTSQTTTQEDGQASERRQASVRSPLAASPNVAPRSVPTLCRVPAKRQADHGDRRRPRLPASRPR